MEMQAEAVRSRCHDWKACCKCRRVLIGLLHPAAITHHGPSDLLHTTAALLTPQVVRSAKLNKSQ